VPPGAARTPHPRRYATGPQLDDNNNQAMNVTTEIADCWTLLSIKLERVKWYVDSDSSTQWQPHTVVSSHAHRFNADTSHTTLCAL